MHRQLYSLPALIGETIDPLLQATRGVFSRALCQPVRQVYLTGCGDSFHAAVGAALAFRQLAGLPCEALPAMAFSRFRAAYLPDWGRGGHLLLGISVSGQVSRTIEALELGRQAGAVAVALTGHAGTPLAQAADQVVASGVPPLPEENAGTVVPGVRSYFASLLALYLCAIQLGQSRGHLSQARANHLRRELSSLAAGVEQTIARCTLLAGQLAQDWREASHFVFCGSGPTCGAALFSAAKIVEASGDPALAQELEEWAHIEYFGKEASTPTFLLSSGALADDRAQEIATAARAIGRRLAIVATEDSPLAQAGGGAVHLPLPAGLRPCFSPLLSSLPGALFAASLAQVKGEPYFRAFGGGRSREGGGGVSRIRDSHRWRKAAA